MRVLPLGTSKSETFPETSNTRLLQTLAIAQGWRSQAQSFLCRNFLSNSCVDRDEWFFLGALFIECCESTRLMYTKIGAFQALLVFAAIAPAKEGASRHFATKRWSFLIVDVKVAKFDSGSHKWLLVC